MSRVKERPGVAAGPNRKSVRTSKNSADLQKMQSPWARPDPALIATFKVLRKELRGPALIAAFKEIRKEIRGMRHGTH